MPLNHSLATTNRRGLLRKLSGTTTDVLRGDGTWTSDPTFTTALISANSAGNAFEVRQTGAGNAIVVEDSTNPDATPFVVDASGRIIRGHTEAITTFSASGDTPSTQFIGNAVGTSGAIGIAFFNNTAGNPAKIFAARSKAGVIGTYTAVANNDELLFIDVQGSDGTDFAVAARITFTADGTVGANQVPGRITFSTANSSGTLTARAQIKNTGSVILNASGSALATTATDGFTYVPSCAGTPTGVPTAVTGAIPIVVDSTNSKLYFYSNGAWRDAGP